MRALGRSQDMFSDTGIQLQPIFAQWIQNIHTLAPSNTSPNSLATASYAFGGDTIAVANKIAMMPIKLGTADFSTTLFSPLLCQALGRIYFTT